MTNIYQKSINTLYTLLADFFKTYKSTFIVAICAGLLAHMYAFTNKIINFDDITHLFDLGHTIESGRWGLYLLSFVLPNFSIPWFNGIVSLVIFSLSGLLIIDTLNIKNKIHQYLMVALLVTFPSLTVTYTFMFTSLAYSIAFICSILPIWLLKKYSIKRFALATLFLTFSLSIYQAYITCCSALFFLVILNDILLKETDTTTLLKNILKYIITIILALIIYFIANRVFQLYSDISFCGYAKGALSQNEPFIIKCKIVLRTIIDDIFHHKHCLLPSNITSWMFICTFCCLFLILIPWFIKSKSSRWEKIAATIIILSMPICVNSLYLIVDSYHIHSLVLYSFVFLLFTPIVIFNAAEYKNLSFIKIIGITALSIIIIQYIYFANYAYLYLDLQYRQVYAYAIELADDIRDFRIANDSNYQVAIIGDIDSGKNSFKNEFHINDESNRVMGMSVLSGYYTLGIFIHNYIDNTIPFTILQDTELENIESSEVFSNMKPYPSKNSIKIIDNFIVVKLNMEE